MRVELDTDGTIEEIEFRQLREEDRLGQKWIGEVFVFRDDFQQTSTETGVTEVTVLDGQDVKFSGRLNDVNWEQSLAVLVCDSWEEDADEAPLQRGANATGTKFEEQYENTSSETIFTDSINNVPGLTVGDVAPDASTVTHDIVFSNASQREKIRTLELGDPFFVTYNYDKSVDLTASPGRDRTNITLGPQSDNVEGDIIVVDDGFDDSYTDLLVLGAGSGGDDQLSTTRVLDPNADRRKEKRVNYKNITTQSYLEDVADEVQDEIQRDFQQVELTIRDLQVDIGDEFTVVKEEEGVNDTFYVWDYERTLSSVDKYDVVLSTRRKFRTDTESEILSSIDDYETAKEPPVVFLNGGGGNRSPVGPGNNWEMTQAYPEDVLFERNVELNIRGRAYRAFSFGASGGGSYQNTSTSTPTNSRGGFSVENTRQQVVNIEALDQGGDWTTVEALGIDGDDDYAFGHVSVQNSTDSVNHEVLIRISVNNQSYNTIGFQNNAIPPGLSSFASGSVFADLRDVDTSNENVRLQVAYRDLPNNSSRDEGVESNMALLSTHEHDVEINIPNHTHDPDPGIIDFTDLYPENIDVIVNGTTVASDVAGDGTSDFETTVDLSGVLTPGFNEIEVTSDSLGHIEASLGGRLTLQNTL
jgi:hypothetical protein